MFKTKQKNNLIIWLTAIVVVMLLFSLFGTAVAYFQIEKNVTGSFKVGNVTAGWYNGTTPLTSTTSYTFNVNSKLTAGDTTGVYITMADGTAGGKINIKAGEDSSNQYVRVKAVAMIDDIDVSEYLSYRYIDTEQGLNYTMGTNDFWKKDGDWYYYVDGDTNVLGANGYVVLFNNIMLSGDFPSNLRGKQITITFTYESIQSANNAVSDVWGVTFLNS